MYVWAAFHNVNLPVQQQNWSTSCDVQLQGSLTCAVYTWVLQVQGPSPRNSTSNALSQGLGEIHQVISFHAFHPIQHFSPSFMKKFMCPSCELNPSCLCQSQMFYLLSIPLPYWTTGGGKHIYRPISIQWLMLSLATCTSPGTFSWYPL